MPLPQPGPTSTYDTGTATCPDGDETTVATLDVTGTYLLEMGYSATPSLEVSITGTINGATAVPDVPADTGTTAAAAGELYAARFAWLYTCTGPVTVDVTVTGEELEVSAYLIATPVAAP